MSLVAYASSDEGASGSEDDSVERNEEGKTEVAPRHSASSFLSSLPAPKTQAHPQPKSGPRFSILGLPAPKNPVRDPMVDVMPKGNHSDGSTPGVKKKNTVKISLPDLPGADSDEDDDDEPVKKKPKPSGLSGLMSLLPQPKQAVTKETNRPLIPYTLTKKPVPPAPSIHRSSAKPVRPLMDADDTDNEEEGAGTSNFFSLGELEGVESVVAAPSSNSIVNSRTVTVAQADENSAYDHLSTTSVPPVESTYPSSTTDSIPSSDSQNQSAVLNLPGADAPLTFKGGATSQMSRPQRQYGYMSCEVDTGYQEDYSYRQPQASDESSNYAGDSQDVSQYLQDEQFLRLQGKNRRGKEAINIIDVNAADQMASEIQMTKGISEEDAGMSRSTKHKNDLPSTQQRRKHQITYLAHQAQEREFELRNQWASNRATKKQTQAKYGF